MQASRRLLRSLRLGAPLLAALAGIAAAAPQDQDLVARGRYLSVIGGCNDCHTPGYLEHGGKADEAVWLTGNRLGWRGPWGTTYPLNLRLYVQNMDEAQWLERLKTMQPRPPMPWFNVRAMSERDQRALFRFLKALGPAGQPAPAYLPPDQTPPPPFVQFPS